MTLEVLSANKVSVETVVIAIVTVFVVVIVVVVAIRIGMALGSTNRRGARDGVEPVTPSQQSVQQPRRPISSSSNSQPAISVQADRPNLGGIGVSLTLGSTPFAPAKQSGRGAAKLTWYGPGETLIHGDQVIDSGMLYVSERALTWPGEPSAIITSLSVGRTAAHPLQDFGYYPAYDRITSEQRRSYLEWLAAGRQDSDPSQRSLGHVFMFFYGLERRILADADRDTRLLEEIIRLLQHYGSAHKSRSLRTYLLQLLHFGGWQRGPAAYRALWPRLLELDDDRPDEDGLRFVLANLHLLGEPLDWTVAYRLALSSEESRRSTVVTRAQEKFFALFEQRFHEKFGTGLVPEAAKRETLVQYRPASGALTQMRYEAKQDCLELRLPNVTGLHRQFKVLPEIWNSCVDDLSGYSRALVSNKQGQAAALARWQALPAQLRKIEEHPLRTAFDELLSNAPIEGDYSFVPTASLASLADIPERAKLTTVQSRQVTELVAGLGWQLAPDPEITGLPLAWNQELALYRSAADEQHNPNISGLMRLLYLAVTLAAADGAIEAEELSSFYRLISAEVALEADWRPLRATEASLRRDANVAVRSLPQMAKLIPSESRQFVLRTMAHIAAADTEVSLDELKVLRRMARAFGLDANTVEILLREDEAFREVTVAGAERSSSPGEKIPLRPSSTPVFALNQDRINALTQETKEVISMLSVVMTDEDEIPCAPPTPPPAVSVPARVDWLNGLNPRYHSAVLSLVQRDEITTSDFDCLAADHHLIPDDLFNTVNTWADDVLGDFLLERGENVRVFRSLLPEAAALPIAA